MPSYAELVTADRRLSVLLLLEATPGHTANEALLQAALPDLGHDPPGDTVRADLAWLDEQGLVTTGGTLGLTMARLTERGADVAAGRATHPGVKKRRP